MSADLTELALAFGKSGLFVLATLLPILNPAATAPIFLGLTEGASPHTRAVLAWRIARNMFLLMVGAMLVGSYVLNLFGISLPIVRVGGGLIVASNAWRLLNASHTGNDSRQALAEGFTPEQARRQAFYPLTFPITCVPGSIAAAITRLSWTGAPCDESSQKQLRVSRHAAGLKSPIVSCHLHVVDRRIR